MLTKSYYFTMPNLLIRTLPVQAGTAAYRECLRCDAIIRQANAQLAALKPRIEENKRKSAMWRWEHLKISVLPEPYFLQ